MRQSRRESNGSEFAGNIVGIRAIEDCIRASKKYTEGIETMRAKHPTLVQGNGFPSRVFHKWYEVYPNLEVQDGAIWDMAAGIALDWLWGETSCINVLFKYDYRSNKASMAVKKGAMAVRELARAIPDFSEMLARVVADGDRKVGNS